MNDNLDNRIWCAKNNALDLPHELTETEKAAILALIGAKCRATTKQRLERRLNTPLSCWERFGIYSRMVFKNGDADYICGQSWPDEMRTLRECVLN